MGKSEWDQFEPYHGVPAQRSEWDQFAPAGMPGQAVPPPAAVPPVYHQSLTAAAPGAIPRTRGIDKPAVVDSPDQSAGVWATVEASLHPDPQKQIQAYAKARGLNPARYGIDREGAVVFLNDNGQFVREVPSLGAATGPVDFFRRLGQNLGAQFGPSIPQAAAVTAGLVAGPTGASIPAAAGAAAAGDYVRQKIGNAVTGTEGTDWWNVAVQGAMSALGQGVTVGLDKAFSRNLLGVSAADGTALRDPARVQRISDAVSQAQSWGVNVTPGEAGNVRSLINQQRQLGRRPESSTPLYDFYQERNAEQLPKAFGNMLDQISMVSAPAVGARHAQRGAQEAIDFAVAARSKAASPHYEEAFASGAQPEINGVLSMLTEFKKQTANSSDSAKALDKVRKMLVTESEVVDPTTGKTVMAVVPESDYRRLHNAKLQLDRFIDDVDASPLSIDKETKWRLTEIQRSLTGQLRQTHPAYEQGYQRYLSMSPTVDDLTGGIVGLAARERMGGLQGVPRTLVDITNSDPISVATAKTAFLKAGREEEWNAAVRSYLAGTFDKALRRQTGPANEVFTTLFQDPRQRANLQAALTPPQYRGFEDLMKVFEMVRRAPPEGSTTITDRGGDDALVSPGAKLVSRGLKSMSLEVMPRLSEWVDGLSAGHNAEQLVKVITTPAAVEELKKLRLLSPGSQKAVTVLDGILARIGAYKVAPTPPERMPPAAGGGVP